MSSHYITLDGVTLHVLRFMHYIALHLQGNAMQLQYVHHTHGEYYLVYVCGCVRGHANVWLQMKLGRMDAVYIIYTRPSMV